MPLFFKALADETRLRLAHILFHYELSVNELVQIMGIGQSRVSRHLKILTEAGLLRSRRDGLRVFYSAPPAGQGRNFLATALPFSMETAQFNADFALAGQAIEERARKTRQFFNAFADDWDALNHEILGNFDLPGRVVGAMPEDCHVAVDLGCGTGEVMFRILEKAARVIGVDGSARMLELCKSRLGTAEKENASVSLRIGELNHLPLADREANFACLNLVLHHLAQPTAIFPEIHRIMRPGGRFFIADFHTHDDEGMRVRYGDQWLGFDCEKICSELEKAGFTVIETENAPVGKNLELFLITAKIQSA